VTGGCAGGCVHLSHTMPGWRDGWLLAATRRTVSFLFRCFRQPFQSDIASRAQLRARDSFYEAFYDRDPRSFPSRSSSRRSSSHSRCVHAATFLGQLLDRPPEKHKLGDTAGDRTGDILQLILPNHSKSYTFEPDLAHLTITSLATSLTTLLLIC
jgi:hypothetical protein